MCAARSVCVLLVVYVCCPCLSVCVLPVVCVLLVVCAARGVCAVCGVYVLPVVYVRCLWCMCAACGACVLLVVYVCCPCLSVCVLPVVCVQSAVHCVHALLHVWELLQMSLLTCVV